MDPSERDRIEKAHADTDEARLEFVRNEIESGRVFAGLAETEGAMGEQAAAWSALAKAERACEVARHFLDGAHTRGQDVDTLEDTLKQVRSKMGSLRQQLDAKDWRQ